MPPGEAAGPPAMLDLIEGLDGIDPRTLAILKLAMGGNAGAATPAAPADDAATLRARIAQLEAANGALVTFTDRIAGALGACPDCFGADPVCGRCAGLGAPGFYPAERSGFEAFVLPVVRALSGRMAARQRQAAAAPAAQWPGRPFATFHHREF